MAQLNVNQWLQDAVERACEKHVKQLYEKEAHDSGDDYIYVTSEPEYGYIGINVTASWGLYPKETERRTVFFTPQEAFKIFMEHNND